MLGFDAGTFAIAGLLAGLGPVVVHLLNRRRFRVVGWAAMDFLKQALERQRRILHLRDLWLLVLRVLAVVAFGLALARPYLQGGGWGGTVQLLALVAAVVAAAWLGVSAALAVDASRRWLQGISAAICLGFAMLGLGGLSFLSEQAGSGSGSQREPVHAVLVLDNSRSMATTVIAETRLAAAQQRARDYIQQLPPDSRVTVIPLCGPAGSFSLDAYRNRDDAQRAVAQIQQTDALGDPAIGLQLADRAARQSRDLPAKRIVVLTDLQATNWNRPGLLDGLQAQDGVQVVRVGRPAEGNLWVSDFHWDEELASAETPGRFLARLQAAGEAGNGLASSDSNRDSAGVSGGDDATTIDVSVTLKVADTEVSSLVVSLVPGQVRELAIPYQFDGPSDPQRPTFIPAEIEIRPTTPGSDDLIADNTASTLVPVMAAVSVVMVDPWGSDEDVAQNRLGETYALRRLLAPRTTSETQSRQLYQVTHLKPEQLTVDTLEGARVLVIAGLERPELDLALVREFAEQGGSVILAAGGGFDPAAWNTLGWNDGQGILPCPLLPDARGSLPDEAAGSLNVFSLAFDSLQPDRFLLPDEDPEYLQQLYSSIPFFRYVEADVSPATLTALFEADVERLTRLRGSAEGPAGNPAANGGEPPNSSAAVGSANATAVAGGASTVEPPRWWLWRSTMTRPIVGQSVADQARAAQPRVLARFSSQAGAPYLVQRRIGDGQVLLLTSGLSSNWNLLRSSPAIFFLHRLVSDLVSDTLPPRNHRVGERVVLPASRRDDWRYVLQSPTGDREPISVEAIGPDRYGVLLRHLVRAGRYVVEAERIHRSGAAASLRDEVVSPQVPADLAGPEAETSNGSGRSIAERTELAIAAAPAESDLTALSDAAAQQLLGTRAALIGPTDSIPIAGGARRGQSLWKTFALAALVCLLAEMLLLAWPQGKTTGRPSGSASPLLAAAQKGGPVR